MVTAEISETDIKSMLDIIGYFQENYPTQYEKALIDLKDNFEVNKG